jgi:hypothetical protein
MLKKTVKILFLAAGFSMGAASAVAGPVLYASSDPETSSGTELYVIDPIAATITVVRGVGIGASATGTFGGSYGGGYAGGSSGGGAGGAGGAGGVGAGGSVGGAPGSSLALTSSSDPQAPSAPVDLADPGPSRTPQRPMIVLSNAPQPQLSDDILGVPKGGTQKLLLPEGCPTCTDTGGGDPTGDNTTRSTLAGEFVIAAVPEPASLALLGLALATLGLLSRRKPI